MTSIKVTKNIAYSFGRWQQGKSQKLWSFPKFSPSSIVSGRIAPSVSGNISPTTAPIRARRPRIVKGKKELNRACAIKNKTKQYNYIIELNQLNGIEHIYEIDDVWWNDGRHIASNVDIGLSSTKEKRENSVTDNVRLISRELKKERAAYNALGTNSCWNQFGAVL